MNIKIAQAISRLSLYVILAVVLLLAAVIGVGLLCAALSVNPFTSRVTGLMFSLFSGSLGVAAAAMLLNMAVNLSIIADRNAGIFAAEGGTGRLANGIKAYLALAALTALVVVVGTLRSRSLHQSRLRDQAAEVMSQNQALVEKIGLAVGAATPEALNTIPQSLEFLAKQRRDFPGVLLLYGGSYEGKPALYQMGYWSKNLKPKEFQKDCYSCQQEVDCAYLRAFFGGGEAAPMEHVDNARDAYLVYRPVAKDQARFVLLFSKHENYGKLGSRYDSSL